MSSRCQVLLSPWSLCTETRTRIIPWRSLIGCRKRFKLLAALADSFGIARNSATISIQLCWMSKLSHPLGTVWVDEMVEDIVHQETYAWEGTIVMVKTSSLKGILSGDIIEIRTLLNDTWNMKIMIDLQWALLLTLAMSRATSSLGFLHGDNDDDNASKIFFNWLNAVKIQEVAR